MHYSVLVITDKPKKMDEKSIDQAVSRALMPYEGSEWDWWQVGGRWTGAFDGYDPEKDPSNQMKCRMCNGTGSREWPIDISQEWIKQCNGCNVCHGTGIELKWPTSYTPHAGDIQPVSALTEEQLSKFYAVCIIGHGWFGGEQWLPWEEEGKRFKPGDRPTLAWLKTFSDHIAVVVDCHN